MKILVTGAKGFVGKNLCAALENIRDGKDRTRSVTVSEIFEYDLDTDPALLDGYCAEADFVFHLAGVNRPQNPEEFMQGNFGFTSTLLDTLKKHKNTCPVMISSSIQATCIGRYDSDYGRSKKAGEELVFSYGEAVGARVLVYRFPNLFGKWCRPNYNSAVATFCNNIANDLPITVNDRNAQLELLYIDDLVEEMIAALDGREHHCEFDGITTLLCDDGKYCAAPITHKVTLGEIVDLLDRFKAQPSTLMMPEIPTGSFAKKLYSTYLSERKGVLSAEDEYRRPRQLYRADENREMRSIQCKYLQTRHYQGTALAPHEVGVFHRRQRSRTHRGAQDRLGRGAPL